MAKRRRPRRDASARSESGRDAPHRSERAAGNHWRIAAIVFAVAAGVRLIHVWQLGGSPFSSILLGDAVSYDSWAAQIASGDWLGHEVFYQAPLYPYFLGTLYALFGRDIEIVRIVQALLGAGSCTAIAVLGARLFDRRAGLIAGLLLALYPPSIFFDGLVQKASLDLVFSCWLLLAVASAGDEATPLRSGSLGLALGSLTLTRENSLLLVPVLIGWLAARARRALVPIAAFVVCLAAVLLPIGIRNGMVGGEFHLTTSQFGPNLFIGNNDRATGTYVALRPGRGTAAFERQDATELAQAAAGRPLTPGEVSDYWSTRAFSWMTGHPADALALFARKLVLVWNAQEIVDTEDLQTHAEWSSVLRVLSVIFHFGILAPLGILGMWATRQRWRDLWVYYAICLAYSLSVAAFYVLARYRYPLVPVLALFAGPGVQWALSGWRSEAKATALGTVAGLAAVVVLVNWPLVPPDAMRAATHFNLGQEYQTRGQPDAAVNEYRTVLALWPTHAPAHSNLGVLLAARQQYDEAASHYRDALRIDPSLVDAQVNLGIELARKGSDAEAIDLLTKALALDPANSVAHYNLGVALGRAGDMKQAIDHFEKAVQGNPKYFEARNNLAVLLAASGRYDAAVVQFEAAAALRPDDPATKMNLERARALAIKKEQ